MGNHWMFSCFNPQGRGPEGDTYLQFNQACTSGQCALVPPITVGGAVDTSDGEDRPRPSTSNPTVVPSKATTSCDEDPLLKVGQVVQKFAEARLDGASLKSMRHALELITEEWRGSFARIHIATVDDALLLAGAASPSSTISAPQAAASPSSSPRPQPLDFPMDSEHLLLDLQQPGLAISAALAAGSSCYSWRDGGQPDQAVPPDYLPYVAAGSSVILSVAVKMAGDIAAVLTFGLTQAVETSGVSQHQWPTYLRVMAASLTTLFMSPTVPRYLALALAVNECSELDAVVSTAVHRLSKLAGQDGNKQLWFRVALTPPHNTGKAVLFDVPSEAWQMLRVARKSLTNIGTPSSQASPTAAAAADPQRRLCHSRSVPNFRLPRAASGLHVPRSEVDPEEVVLRTSVVMEHSLLRHAAEGRQRVLVPNIQKLLNHSGRVATDIFSVGQVRPPAAVLVIPLLKPLPAGSAPASHYETSFGAVYCMSNVPTDFADVKAQLCEAVMEVLSPHMHAALAKEPLLVEYEELFVRQSNSMRSDSTIFSSGDASRRRSMRRGDSSLSQRTLGKVSFGNCDSAFDCVSMSPSESGSAAAAAAAAFVSTPTSCTQALVTGLTDKINAHRIMQSLDLNEASCNLEDLQLLSVLGSGGYGCVFRGKWRGMVAAVKIVWCPISDDVGNKEVLKHAHEIAILSSVSHPNIIQAYTFMTDVSVGDVMDVCLGEASYAAKADPAFSKLVSMEQANCHVQVLEYCDKASLAEALQANWFQRRSVAPAVTDGGGGRRATGALQPLKGVPPDMPTLLLSLLELASALAHLHAMGIVHCDIKPENVLLKSCANDARGFSVKLTDFGLSRVLDEDGCMEFPCNSCGTLAYVAPEALPKKNKVDRSIDVYSFGILMYELYANRRPYPDLSQKDVIHGVTMLGLRPRFAPDAHAGYVGLARACWHNSRHNRPSVEYVVAALTDMLAEATRGASH